MLVRPGPYGPEDLGLLGWKTLHELALLRSRDAKSQVRHLLLYALDRHIAGEDVELSQDRLEALLGVERGLESVA